MLNDLESISAGTPEHQAKLKKIMEHLHEHNDSEEIKDLPLLEPLLDDSKEVAMSFKKTKKFVPTRSDCHLY